MDEEFTHHLFLQIEANACVVSFKCPRLQPAISQVLDVSHCASARTMWLSNMAGMRSSVERRFQHLGCIPSIGFEVVVLGWVVYGVVTGLLVDWFGGWLASGLVGWIVG